MSSEKSTEPTELEAEPLLEPLLAVHSAPTPEWLADAASTAAERGLGALYCLAYLADASGRMAGQRPASRERMRALARLRQELQTDLTSHRLDPRERPELATAIQEEHAASFAGLSQVFPAPADIERMAEGQRRLGIAAVWVAPISWDRESFGLLLLLMPADPPSTLLQAELLGRHVAVALGQLRQKAAERKLGELDAVRWVYDEQRFLEQLGKEARRAQRHQRPLSVMLLRLQNLDELRARFGRFLADQLLRRLGRRLAEDMRDTDFVGAFRNDGFATILVEADREGARRAEERLVTSLRSTKLSNADLPGLTIQLAYATATLPEDGETAEELTNAAEARLSLEESQEEVA